MKQLVARAARRAKYEGAARIAAPALVGIDHWRGEVRRALRRGAKGPSKKPGLFAPALECTRKLKEIMASHYLSGRYADGAVPVAWVTSGFPVEFLRPLGFHTVYPENHAALCAAQHKGVELAQVAEQWGLPRDTCAYARCDVGSWIAQKTPAGRLPRPDVLLACTNICQTVLHWYRALADMMKVPLLVIDTPFVYGEPDERAERFVAAQIEETLVECARIAGKPLDEQRLRETARLSKEASNLWGECLETSKASPAPWTGFDAFMHIAPIVTIRGLPECNAYYRILRDELRERVRRGVGGIRDEKHRLLWDNLPIWYELRPLSGLLAASGFNIVVTSYTNGWAETAPMFDVDDPFRSAARVYTRVFINRDLRNRVGLLAGLARDYRCDGAILHSNHSCKPYSLGQIDLGERLSAEAGVRTLVLDADHLDARVYSKEQAEGRVAAFMESFG
jgi:benzoyl-CoA reductase/2-hydroxyglutaryl-CoA dehydratase subunit BcrC/BadD/HgdB